DELKEELKSKKYKFGFTSKIDSEKIPVGLNEEVIRMISAKKEEPEWLLEYRLNAFKVWQAMTEPEWAHVKYVKPKFQEISYFSAPRKKYESCDDVDPEMKATMHKLGISLDEQKELTDVAVDFVMDSVSVDTSFKAKLY